MTERMTWTCGLLTGVLLATFHDSTGADAIDARAQTILKNVAAKNVNFTGRENGYKTAHFEVQAKFAVGDDEGAREIIDQALRVKPIVEYYDPEFPLWSTMDCYLRWKDVPGKYTDELKERTRDYISAARIPSDATTYNHHWMLAAGLMLAYQEWGEEVVAYKYSEKDPTGEAYVRAELERIVQRGHTEYNSETYYILSLGPIHSLYCFSEDAEIRHRCRMVLDWALALQAAHYFKGHCGAATKRTYYPMAKQNNSLAPSYLYFGGPPEFRTAQVPFALSDYRPNPIIAKIAWERSQPFVHRESYTRASDQRPPSLRLTSYFNVEYVVFSQYNVREQVPWGWEQLNWAVRWDAPADQVSSFFVKHPWPKYARAWHLGATRFEQVLQHERAIVGIYNIIDGKMPDKVPNVIIGERPYGGYPFIYGVIPDNAQAVIDETPAGRLYLHYGSVMIAYCLMKADGGVPFTWQRPAGTLKLELKQAGFVVETARPRDYEGETPAEQLAAFRNAASAAFEKANFTPDGRASSLPKTERSHAGSLRHGPHIDYTNLAGTEMHLQWQDTGQSAVRKVDGKSVEIDDPHVWPLIENPWVRQDYLDPTLTLVHGDQKVIYDFRQWTINTVETQ